MYLHKYIHIHACYTNHICTYKHIYARIYTNTCVHINMYMHVFTQICTYSFKLGVVILQKSHMYI